MLLFVFGALERPCWADCDMAKIGNEHPVVSNFHADRSSEAWLAGTVKLEVGFDVAVCWAINDTGSGFVGSGCGWVAFSWTEYWAWFIEGWFGLVRLGTLTKSGVVLGPPISVATSERTSIGDTERVSHPTLESCSWGWFATSVGAAMT